MARSAGWGLVVVATLTALAGCGGSGDNPNDAVRATTTTAAPAKTTVPPVTDAPADAYVNTLTVAFSAEPSKATGSYIEPEKSKCVALKWVGIIGIDRLHAKGVQPAELARLGDGVAKLGLKDQQANALIASFDSCGVDVRSVVARSLSNGRTATQAACISEKFTPDIALRFMKKSLVGKDQDGQVQKDLIGLVLACNLNQK